MMSELMKIDKFPPLRLSEDIVRLWREMNRYYMRQDRFCAYISAWRRFLFSNILHTAYGDGSGRYGETKIERDIFLVEEYENKKLQKWRKNVGKFFILAECKKKTSSSKLLFLIIMRDLSCGMFIHIWYYFLSTYFVSLFSLSPVLSLGREFWYFWLCHSIFFYVFRSFDFFFFFFFSS